MLNNKNIVFAALLLFKINTANACTGIQHIAEDGAFINGRTVEFGVNIPMAGLIVPRGYKFNSSLPNNETGMIYDSKYAVIGGNAFGRPFIIDGLNEKGLSAGAFYFSGYAEYGKVTPENKNKALGPADFVNWVLTQFQSTDEVKKALHGVVIAATSQPEWGGVPPFHYIVYDRLGNSIVIEPIDGKLKVYDNTSGAITNSPTFDWHLTNLANYITLSPMNVPQKKIAGFDLKQFGQGNGLRGLPGDFTPPSRFVRAVLFSATIPPAKNAQQAVFEVFHILNQFDIPYGAVRSANISKPTVDYTQSTTVKDPKNLKYYFKTYSDQTIRSISLNEFDLDCKIIKQVDISRSQQKVKDLSKQAKPLMFSKDSNQL